MKVFISHMFGEEDERLGSVLKEDIDVAGMEGYLAEKTPRYDLLIGDKLRQEIGESEWVVAIITKRSQTSASVHQEIGYALGKGIKVALLVEDGVTKSGVFTYGREVEFFTVAEFKKHCGKVVKFIKDGSLIKPRQGRPVEETVQLLTDRKIASVTSSSFAMNDHFAHLHSPVSDDTQKPAVLFTACPRNLATDVDVATKEFAEWAGSIASINVDGQQIPLRKIRSHIDIKTLMFVETTLDAPPRREVLSYREYQSGGFFECGTSYTFFTMNRRDRLEMDLCHLIGNFWAFLAHARLFYKKIDLDSPISVLLSIRNSRKATLQNTSDETLKPPPPIRIQVDPDRDELTTHHHNIQFSATLGTVDEMTDENIALAAKKAAKHICNAYGEAAPSCYNEDGTFSWTYWKCASQSIPWGAQL